MHNNNLISGLQVKMYVTVQRFMVYRSGLQGEVGMRSNFMYMALIRN